jgi:hypothetical protein
MTTLLSDPFDPTPVDLQSDSHSRVYIPFLLSQLHYLSLLVLEIPTTIWEAWLQYASWRCLLPLCDCIMCRVWLKWSPCSSDLTPLDFFPDLKCVVYDNWLQSIAALQQHYGMHCLAYGAIFTCVSKKMDTSLNSYCGKCTNLCGVPYECVVYIYQRIVFSKM